MEKLMSVPVVSGRRCGGVGIALTRPLFVSCASETDISCTGFTESRNGTEGFINRAHYGKSE